MGKVLVVSVLNQHITSLEQSTQIAIHRFQTVEAALRHLKNTTGKLGNKYIVTSFNEREKIKKSKFGSKVNYLSVATFKGYLNQSAIAEVNWLEKIS